jgi:hypothetical protein
LACIRADAACAGAVLFLATTLFRDAGQLTGRVLFFFFEAEVFFCSGVVRACFCPTDAVGDVCAGLVEIAGDPSGGTVTVGIPDGTGDAVAVGVAVDVCGRVTSGAEFAGSAGGGWSAFLSCRVRAYW